MVDLLDGGRFVPDMNYLRAAGATHQKRRLFDRVMAHGDDKISERNRLMDVVAFRQCCGSHIEVGSACDGTLAHLRVEKGKPCGPNKG